MSKKLAPSSSAVAAAEDGSDDSGDVSERAVESSSEEESRPAVPAARVVCARWLRVYELPLCVPSPDDSERTLPFEQKADAEAAEAEEEQAAPLPSKRANTGSQRQQRRPPMERINQLSAAEASDIKARFKPLVDPLLPPPWSSGSWMWWRRSAWRWTLGIDCASDEPELRAACAAGDREVVLEAYITLSGDAETWYVETGTAWHGMAMGTGATAAGGRHHAPRRHYPGPRGMSGARRVRPHRGRRYRRQPGRRHRRHQGDAIYVEEGAEVAVQGGGSRAAGSTASKCATWARRPARRA